MSDRGRHGFPDQDAGNFSRDRENRNQSYSSGGYDDRSSGLGLDDRFTGRGGGDWTERSYGQDRSGYGRDRGDRGGYRDYSSYRDSERGMAGNRGMEGGMENRGMPPHRGVGGHRGKGPQNWQRSDERIRESVNEALADHDHIDATNIQVTVKDGEVTLSGFVEDRRMKRLAEDCVEQVSGVKEVQNHIRIHSDDNRLASRTGSERSGNERTGSERTGSERTGSERIGSEKDKDKKAQA